MFMTMSEEEIKKSQERKGFLYTSPYIEDNITAILMDTSHGDFGLHEGTARAKTHHILSWLKMIGYIIKDNTKPTEKKDA